MKLKSVLILSMVLLAGCSSRSSLPDFTASGYLADRGAVRIWRKDTHQEVSHMMTVFSPFEGDATEITDYHWQAGNLLSIERHIKGAHPDDITLRFDQQGKLNFMQRQLVGRRESVSADAVELYIFDAQRMLRISDALLTGRVMLKQGHWLSGGEVKTCQGAQEKPALDNSAIQYIMQRQSRSAVPVSIAWLEAPEGTQLLLVANEDFCQWEPTEKDF
ncbi:DUF1481 domain-containing protein [Winslowiella toletana]|uniref:DUF1481 domain-containing protein n=1 Tax=Winslowiella toletana TaxID=92490 RepID=UPI0028BD7557|nr:DUF1481 domain-containing protein [Winslowiella toletana]WNN44077.1 DUF1481 domain-containing protein [Winslowiella toletana]